MTTPVYAVTGASGRLGRLAVEQLTARGVSPPDIVALVRTPAKAVSLAASGVCLAIAGDDQLAKTTAGAFVDAIGYDPYDAGLLSEGWRFQAGATPYAYGAGGSFDHPQPTAARHIADLLSRARHNVK